MLKEFNYTLKKFEIQPNVLVVSLLTTTNAVKHFRKLAVVFYITIWLTFLAELFWLSHIWSFFFFF